jgi:hypothetical protein
VYFRSAVIAQPTNGDRIAYLSAIAILPTSIPVTIIFPLVRPLTELPEAAHTPAMA